MNTNFPLLRFTRSVLVLSIFLACFQASAQRTQTLTEEAALAEQTASYAAWREHLGIPQGDKLYKPLPALTGPHPRLLPAGMSMEELRNRYNDPVFAHYRDSIIEHADFYGRIEHTPPQDFDTEDPWRDYGDAIPWLALAFQLETDPMQREERRVLMLRYMENLINWGLVGKDLPQSQILIGLSLAYDWCYQDLEPRFRQRLRQAMLQYASALRSPFFDAWQWRAQEMWLANHKWYNYTALAVAAAALLEEDQSAGTTNAELMKWIDEAMEMYWVVEHKIFGDDGAPAEGYHYTDYGSYPYWLMGMMAEALTDSEIAFFDSPFKRSFADHRLHSLLPANSGFLVYGDSYPGTFDSAHFFRQLATHHRDPEAQYLAQVMEDHAAFESVPSRPAGSGTPYSEYRNAQPVNKADPDWLLRIEAEAFDVIPEGIEIIQRPGSSGNCLKGWTAPGSEASVSFNVPNDGYYRIWIKHANQGDSQRSLLIDGQAPFAEVNPLWFPDTGGWSRFRNTWMLTTPISKSGEPAEIYLSAGLHRIALFNNSSKGLNLDWLALSGSGWTKDRILTHLGEEEGIPGISRSATANHWMGLFWYDPSVPFLDDLDTLPTHRDSPVLGVYTARRSWTDPESSFLGLLCGPRAGWKVAEWWTSPPSWGHLHPDAGSVVFYWGKTAVLPGVDYPKEKWTTNHSVGVFSIQGRDRPVGQLGEGGRWGQDNDGIKAHPKVLRAAHTDGFHAYLMDLGGAYRLGYDDAGNPIFPEYTRLVVYFPDIDSLLISDRISSPVEAVFHSRLMTAADSMVSLPDSSSVEFRIGEKTGIIRNLSAATSVMDFRDEFVSSWPNGSPRKVLTVRVHAGQQSTGTTLLLSPEGTSLSPEALRWIDAAQAGSHEALRSQFP